MYAHMNSYYDLDHGLCYVSVWLRCVTHVVVFCEYFHRIFSYSMITYSLIYCSSAENIEDLLTRKFLLFCLLTGVRVEGNKFKTRKCSNV